MKILAPILFAALLLTGCTSVQQSTRVSTPLQAMEFNSIASRYMVRPTLVAVEKMSDGATVLLLRMDTYGKNPSMPYGSELRFSKENVADYIAAIDKYFTWSAQAKERKDALTKEITTAPTWGNMAKGALKFTFHSGNDQNHFLMVAFSAAGTTLEDSALYFDEANAKHLRDVLDGFATGRIGATDTASAYK
ncbi:MAG: hypothetical protein QM790_20175 [Nibricoccus sp.]